MQNNQSPLQQYLLFDFDNQYQAEEERNTEDIDLFENLNDNDDSFDQSYAELDERD